MARVRCNEKGTLSVPFCYLLRQQPAGGGFVGDQAVDPATAQRGENGGAFVFTTGSANAWAVVATNIMAGDEGVDGAINLVTLGINESA